MTLSIATDLVMNGDRSYLAGKDENDLVALMGKLDGPQDGVDMWRRAMRWVTQ
jgi:hypothetical protein